MDAPGRRTHEAKASVANSPDHVRRVNILYVADLPMLGEVLLNLLLHERPDRRVHLVPVTS